ncbi:HAAS signaling domain-containing protein [Allokutzneria albata]|uniref:HAAS signaling domain-containing protein n=1 Tax=Allokutzneria albata TaxID=211114 RepID=UPI0012DD8ABB|nr:hypothetical protein [Allokutzneria albata]
MEDQLIRGYLDRLHAAARALPEDRGRELIADVAEHLAVALGDPAVTTEADRRQVLDRLGEPEEIVRAALEEQPVTVFPPAQAPARMSPGVKTALITAVVVLAFLLLVLFLSSLLFAANVVETGPSQGSVVVPTPMKSPTG